MKLPNHYGSVYKLSGKRRNPWAARITTGWKMVSEKKRAYPVYKFIGYYPTKAEALQALANYNEDPYDLHFKTITFEEVYERWSDEHYQKIKDPSGYKAAFNTCLDIWNVPFCSIKLDLLQKVCDASGKNSPTLKTMKNLFSLMYDYAVIHEIVPPEKREMVRYLDTSKPGNPNSIKRNPFPEAAVNRFWKIKDSNVYISVILIMIYTGVRIGELLELKKEDVHLDERWFYVREAKTEAGIREVPIAEKIVPFFEYWLGRDCDTLICTTNNCSFSYSTFYLNYWVPIMTDLGYGKYIIDKSKKKPVYEGHRPHDTRHTCISLLAKAEVDERLIKKIVGHKGQGVTEIVYTHFELPVKLEAINKI